MMPYYCRGCSWADHYDLIGAQIHAEETGHEVIQRGYGPVVGRTARNAAPYEDDLIGDDGNPDYRASLRAEDPLEILAW